MDKVNEKKTKILNSSLFLACGGRSCHLYLVGGWERLRKKNIWQ